MYIDIVSKKDICLNKKGELLTTHKTLNLGKVLLVQNVLSANVGNHNESTGRLSAKTWAGGGAGTVEGGHLHLQRTGDGNPPDLLPGDFLVAATFINKLYCSSCPECSQPINTIRIPKICKN
jgi:hypothetical protein